MLTTTALTKRYQSERAVDAVAGIDLQIKKGEFVAIVGRSGSGKSSLLAMIGGLSKPSAGSVRVAEIDQWALKPDAHAAFRNKQIGFVFQFPSLLPSLQVIDNIALPALIAGTMPEKHAYHRARMLLEEVGLGRKNDFYPNELSGGEQRRVAIARALMNSPQLLLADEPTADLDEETEQEILELLLSMQVAHELTLVVVTHNMDIAARADRVIRMKSGQIVSSETGSMQTVPRGTRKLDEKRVAADASNSTLGVGFDRFIGRLVMLVVPVLAVVWLANFGVTKFESQLLAAQEEKQQALEDLALAGLRAEVKNITFADGDAYDVAIYLRNTTSEQKPLYVLAPAMRGFVQVGNNWQEVSMTPINSSPSRVMKIEGEQLLHYRLEPKVSDFAELIPHYMHVRISNDMIVSPSAQPKSDLIERADNYYVYLKPHNADEAAILKDLHFPGKPPIWIPMPPH
jgi:putative ABC transport system ATP-binding protein/macrolide transport system ATP-binding/permease protein/lipoprotein-releasing system ATP-binding protein